MRSLWFEWFGLYKIVGFLWFLPRLVILIEGSSMSLRSEVSIAAKCLPHKSYLGKSINSRSSLVLSYTRIRFAVFSATSSVKVGVVTPTNNTVLVFAFMVPSLA